MATKNLVFRMTEGRKPVSWQLPIRNVMLPKQDEKTGFFADKLIHYMPGSPSIFVEDYKGDGEAKSIVFEDGVLEVSPTDVLKIEILKKHPWYGIHYELVDNDAAAQKELNNFELQDKAAELVKESDPMRLKATALVLIGQQAFSWTDIMCTAELRKKALNEPQSIIDEFGKDNYESRFIVSLALLRNIIKTDMGNTAVVWSDSGETLIRLAVGENAIDKLSEYLAIQSESSMITMQRLAELAQGKPSAEKIAEIPVVDTAVLKAKDLELSEKDKEIEELKKQLAAKNSAPAPVQETTSNVVTSEGNVNEGDTSKKEDEKEENPAASGNTEPTLEELQAEYVKLSGGGLPPNKKNDAQWLSEKIEAFKAQQ